MIEKNITITIAEVSGLALRVLKLFLYYYATKWLKIFSTKISMELTIFRFKFKNLSIFRLYSSQIQGDIQGIS
jgi:hypothetical protein